MDRAYYSQRIGRGPLAKPTINDVARALTLTIDEMWKRDYMQEWHGFTCVDAGDVDGRAAMSLADHIEAETGWRSAWPLPEPLINLPDDVSFKDEDLLRWAEEAGFSPIDLQLDVEIQPVAKLPWEVWLRQSPCALTPAPLQPRRRPARSPPGCTRGGSSPRCRSDG